VPHLGGQELAQAYRRAKAERFALIGNNIAEPNVFVGILAAYEEQKSDLLVQVTRGAAKFAGGGKPLAGLRAIVRYIQALATEAKVGVFVNLDHVTPDQVDGFIRPALAEGLCASVMIDASALPFAENVRITKGVVDLARPYGVLVEGELGTIKGVEDEIASDEAFYTDPEQALEFVQETGVDLLAVSVGTEHGVSAGRELTLRVDLAQAIAERLRAMKRERPLVLHGASGLSTNQVQALIAAGVSKVNKDTTYQYVYAQAAAGFFGKNQEEVLPPAGTKFDPVTFDAQGGAWRPNKKLFDPRVVGKEIQTAIRAIATEMLAQVGSGGKSLYA